MVWCMKRTNIYLDEAQTTLLDRIAEQEGVSRAEVVRRLLAKALATQTDDIANDLAAIEASFGVDADLSLADRREFERQRHLDRIWQLPPSDTSA